MEACSDRLLRLRIGTGTPASTSYLPAPLPADAGLRVEDDEVDSGALRMRLLAGLAGPRLEFCDGGGGPRLRLDLGSLKAGGRTRLRFDIVGEQHFYGLGQHGQPLDRLGTSRRLWNSHANHGQGGDIGIPLLLSHLGNGLFFDNAALASIDAGDSHDRICFAYETAATAFDLYYLGGDGLRGVLATSAELLGRAPMPPRWALGYLQSTRHFDGPDEVRSLAETFREKRLPCDPLIFLSTYSDGKGWNKAVGRLEFEPSIFPDPVAMLAELKRQDFRIVTHEYPALHRDSPLYAEAAERGYLLDDGYEDIAPPVRPSTNYYEGQRFIDFASPEAARWWWEQHADLVAAGVDAWWLDGGEGSTAPASLSRPEGAALHNRYDLLRQQAFAAGEARDNPGRRTYLLCRSGGAGMSRFGAGCWSGDINNTWATLEAQASLGLNAGLSGVPLWGTDIGGFYAVAPQTAELFLRWFQFGAFNPVFRSHGRNWRMHLPWAYGDEAEAICREYLELRYRLIPYTYTLAYQAHRDGLPYMRPLALNYPDDAEALDRAAEFLWGDDLLVAPVTRNAARAWPVYLPEGDWYDFWTAERHGGPGAVSVAAPLDRLPLFVRGGAIIPMGPPVQHLSGYAAEEITLLAYPDTTSSFTLYDDDGETNAWRHGAYALTTFVCEATADATRLRVEPPDGDAGVIPAARAYAWRIISARDPAVVSSGRSSVPWRRDGRFIQLGPMPGASEINITWANR